MKKIVSPFVLLFACCAPLCMQAQSDGLPRGASNMPYTRYESENGNYGGSASLQSSVQFIQSDIASEASNQRYVSLPSAGSYVQWKTSSAARGVNLRFTMPDNSTGGSLNLYVNNVLAKTINLSSYWAYQYFDVGGEGDPYQTPRAKTFMRFDEVHFTVDNTINAGDTIKIQKVNNDGITYGVDFVELEPVPAAIAQPAGYLSVTDYGAAANDATDDHAAFNACIAAAKSQGKNVYIPAGRFLLSDKLLLNVTNMKITGAGIWYTQVYFSTDKQFYGGFMARSSGVEIANFTMGTANNDRLKYDEVNPRVGQKYKIYKGFMGTYGNGSGIHDVWVEHFECGFWIGGYDAPYPVDVTRNLTIANCRIRNNYADGVNFCVGTSGSTVTQCSLRNNGDDALAMWPASDVQGSVQERNNIFSNNTIENTWRAGSIAIFGGTGHQVHHNYIKDGVAGSGIRFTNDFAGFGFEFPGDVTHFYENTIENCGTSYDLWNQKRGAIEIFAGSGIFNMQFDNTTILNSQRDAIRISGNNLHHIVFTNTIITGTGKDPVTRDIPADVYGGFGIYCDANSQSMTFNNLSVTDAESGTYINRNPSFQLIFQNVNVPVTGVVHGYPAGGTITIDGVVNEANWKLNNTITKNVIGTLNNTVTFGALWDNNNLYIAAKVLDNTLNNDSPDSWNNDGIEVFIDANNNKGATYDGHDNQFIKGWNSSTLLSKTVISGVQHAWAAISGGYTVEISIPWSQLGITPAAGLQTGFDIANDDDDSGGNRDAQGVWKGTVNNYQSTAAFGTLVLDNTSTALLNNLVEQSLGTATSDETGIQIVPNPVSNGSATVVVWGTTETGSIKVFDMAGHLVYTTKGGLRIPLHLQALPKGMYMVRYESGTQVINKKLLIK